MSLGSGLRPTLGKNASSETFATSGVNSEKDRDRFRIIADRFAVSHLRGRRAGKARHGFTKRWELACKQAGVPGRLLHDFRRTAVLNLERAGVARSVAMKITGHKTESVYRRYAIVSDSDLREAALKLASANDALQGHNFGHSDQSLLDTYRATTQNS